MFEVYSAWCEAKEIGRFNKDKLGKNLVRFVPYLTDVKINKKRAWGNVRFPLKGDSYHTYLTSIYNIQESKYNSIYSFLIPVTPVSKNQEKLVLDSEKPVTPVQDPNAFDSEIITEKIGKGGKKNERQN